MRQRVLKRFACASISARSFASCACQLASRCAIATLA